MKIFNDNNFLLTNKYGKKLYHSVAASLPVIDPHNHIDTASLAAGKAFENLYQLSVQGDPYKHRAMRIYGIKEELITGNGTDYEKFLAWAEVYPHTVGNPLYHWGAMELEKVFGIRKTLSPARAKGIWDKAAKTLAEGNLVPSEILRLFKVEMLCTSDDLIDTLENHLLLAKQQPGIACLPSLRGDNILALDRPDFEVWLKRLAITTNTQIENLADYKKAIVHRLTFFDQAGCLLSDHSLDSGFDFTPADETTAAPLFQKVLTNQDLAPDELTKLRSHLLHFLGNEYASRGWKMQLHIGAYRYTSSVLRAKAGPAGGYACIGNATNIKAVCSFLDELDKENALPKTILYNLNPSDNEAFASLTGSYAEEGVQGKIQYGPPWWYNDHEDGIVKQLRALSSYGLLATSIGMTTDSRSISSFIRHDYYRRILCNLLGSWVHEGKLPDDWKLMSNMVQNIAYKNIKNWLKK